MKLNYSKRNFSTYLLSFFVLVLSSSCIVYQNVPEEDGIYSDGDVTFSTEKKKTRVIEANSDEHKQYEKNYFTRELESLEEIEDSDILTDIDNYNSVTDTISEVEINYTPQAWGYGESDDIVININLDNGYRWGGGFWNFGWPYYDYGFFNPWFGQRHYWGWFYNRPFYRPWGWGWGRWRGGAISYAHYRFRAESGYRYNNYINMRYGRRGGAYGRTGGTYSSRVAANTNSIYSRSRRVTSTDSRRNSNVYRRGSQTTRGTNSSTTTPTRTKTRFTRGDSNNTRTRSNTNTRTRNTRSSNRSRANSRSSSRSRSSSTRSSSRGSSTRSSSRSSSSRSRGSSSRGSSRKRG